MIGKNLSKSLQSDDRRLTGSYSDMKAFPEIDRSGALRATRGLSLYDGDLFRRIHRSLPLKLPPRSRRLLPPAQPSPGLLRET